MGVTLMDQAADLYQVSLARWGRTESYLVIGGT